MKPPKLEKSMREIISDDKDWRIIKGYMGHERKRDWREATRDQDWYSEEMWSRRITNCRKGTCREEDDGVKVTVIRLHSVEYIFCIIMKLSK